MAKLSQNFKYITGFQVYLSEIHSKQNTQVQHFIKDNTNGENHLPELI
jgi:hypothetical protein